MTAGSRGIANIPVVLRGTAEYLKKLGARPFIVPAMGSHAGGSADGQKRLLESYGITEEFVGVPIRASMDVVSLGSTTEGFPVVLDKFASEADHIAVIGRVKPHTGYHGPIESGLLKMMMIGLGKHAGALTYHRILLEQPFDRVVRSVARTIKTRAPIAFGLGIVENAYEETALIRAVPTEEFEPREEEMLILAKKWIARLPLRQADLLIVDEIGKDISGSGMDTNVIVIDRIAHVAVANGLLRIECVSAATSSSGQEKPSGTVLIPALVAGQVIQSLVAAIRLDRGLSPPSCRSITRHTKESPGRAGALRTNEEVWC